MIGDRLDTDILGGINAKMLSIMVLTGVSTRAEAEAGPIAPDLIYADLPAPGALQPGDYVEGRIVTGQGRALTVPAAAVVQRDGHAYVFTLDDKRVAHRVRVRTGARVGGRVEILEGLKAGDAVVAQGAGFLGDGDSVRVVEAAAPAAARPAAAR